MAQQVKLTATVLESQLGQRLDQSLAELFPDYSRSRIKEWILDRRVSVNGTIVDTPKEKVLGGETVMIQAEIEEEARWEAQNIPLDIVYEDEHILVINKPRDLVVHQAREIQTAPCLMRCYTIIRLSLTYRVRASFIVLIKILPA